MFVLVKILTSAIIIGIITEIARKAPTIGGIIAALPLVSILSLIWLFIQGENSTKLNQFLIGVLYGFPSTIILLTVVWLALKNSYSIISSIAFGLVAWGAWLIIQETVIRKMITNIF